MFICVVFTANYVDPASSGSSFEPCHKIAINVAFLHEKNATSLCSHILSLGPSICLLGPSFKRKTPNDVRSVT